jgi:hypothetical protein
MLHRSHLDGVLLEAKDTWRPGDTGVRRACMHQDESMYMTRIIAIFLLIVLCSTPARVQDKYSFHDETPMISGNDKGRVELRLEKLRLRRGELYDAQFTFYNTNSNYWVYNPSFNRLILLPGQLTIYDADKKYIGDLKFDTVSQRSPGDTDWVYLWSGSHIGAKIGFRAGYLPGTKYWNMENLLPAGRYYIQLILYKAFLSIKPKFLVGEKIDFYKTFDRSELCRSSAIEVELID